MSGEPKTITLREYEKFAYDRIGEKGVRRLERAANVTGARVFDFHLDHARARQYVGVVKSGQHTVQILPKVHDQQKDSLGYLLSLLHYTRKLRIHPGDVTGFDKLGGSFLEVWIRHFATELNRLLRTQYKQRYVEIEERSSFLRGKLLTERELNGKATIHARYACRYEIFTPDHLLNRTLKFCNHLLLSQTRSPVSRRTLRENDTLLIDVTYKPVRPEELDRITLDRLNRSYEPILDLCRLLLANSTLDLRAGRISQLAIVFDMDKLFEEFVAEFLRHHADEITVGEGSKLRSAVPKKSIGRLFGELRMAPDLALTDVDGGKILLDTKNKDLPVGGTPAREDLYQMYAYGTAGEDAYAGIILLYPMAGSHFRGSSLRHGDLRLHTRSFDLKVIYDPANRRVDRDAVVDELNRALSFAGSVVLSVSS